MNAPDPTLRAIPPRQFERHESVKGKTMAEVARMENRATNWHRSAEEKKLITNPDEILPHLHHDKWLSTPAIARLMGLDGRTTARRLNICRDMGLIEKRTASKRTQSGSAAEWRLA